MKLSGKTVLITGGAMGMGKGLAEAVLQQGAQVSLLDLREDIGRQTEAELQKKFGANKVFFIPCDVTVKKQLEDAFEATKQMFQYIDVVVNNAGILKESNWPLMIELNLTAVIRGCELGIQYMSKESGGRGGVIMNASSVAGLMPLPETPIYAATKHGVLGLTRSLALTPRVINGGLRLCCMCPSLVSTAFLDNQTPEVVALQENTLKTFGALSVPDVVKGYMMMLEWDDFNGGVVIVDWRGIRVKFPAGYKPKL